MNKVICYDTETTGLPIWGSPSEHPDQPRVIQIAAELFDDETGATLAGLNVIVKPDGWNISDEIAALTGITMEKAMDVGLPMGTVLSMFIDLWQLANLHRMGHNESFDMRMIRIELMRHMAYGATFADKWKEAPAYCTMGSSTKIVNLPPSAKMLAVGRKTPKSPNLAEAYKHFTGLELEGAHNAANDIAATKAVYFGIKKHTQGAAA